MGPHGSQQTWRWTHRWQSGTIHIWDQLGWSIVRFTHQKPEASPSSSRTSHWYRLFHLSSFSEHLQLSTGSPSNCSLPIPSRRRTWRRRMRTWRRSKSMGQWLDVVWGACRIYEEFPNYSNHRLSRRLGLPWWSTHLCCIKPLLFRVESLSPSWIQTLVLINQLKHVLVVEKALSSLQQCAGYISILSAKMGNQCLL